MSSSKGRTRSNSQQQSASNSYGENQGGGFSKGQSESDQNVWNPQGQALQQMYAGAQGQVPGAQDNINAMNPQVMSSWNNIMNPGVNPQLEAYQNQVGQNFKENILPGIGDQAAMAGGYGGSRQGVAQGVAAGRANQQVTDMAANLYNQDQNRMMQGIGMAPGIANAGMSPYQSLAGILGNANILGSSNTLSQAGDYNKGWQGSQQRSGGSSRSKGNTKSLAAS